jgi:hypothetical protein
MKKLFIFLIIILILSITAGAAYIYIPRAANAIYEKWVGPWLEIHKSFIFSAGKTDEGVSGESDADASEKNGEDQDVSGEIDTWQSDAQQASSTIIEGGGLGDDSSEYEQDKELEDMIIAAAEKIIGNGGLTLSKELLQQLSLEEMLKAYQILQSIDSEDRKEISRIVKKERSIEDVEQVKEILKTNLDRKELETLYNLIVSREW